MDQTQIMKCVQDTATKVGVDPDLAMAIAMVESGGYPLAIRFEPSWKYFYQPELFAHKNGLSMPTEQVLQASSFGAMQVMGAVARERGFIGNLLELVTDPELAISYAVKHLKGFVDRYPALPSAISAYNQGSPRKIDVGDGAGVKFRNQAYVDSVLARMSLLKKI